MTHRTGTIRMVRVSVTALAVAFLPVAARAQVAAVAADSGRSLHLRTGAGVDLNSPNGSANAVLGVEWRRPGSRLSARFDVDYFRRESQFNPSLLDMCTGLCTKGTSTLLVGGSIGGQFDLTTTRFRPYLFSGIGLYRSTLGIEMNARCDNEFACVLTPGEFSTRRTHSGSVGLHSGLGFSLQAGRSELFTEFRFQTQTNGFRWHTPMTFGVRF